MGDSPGQVETLLHWCVATPAYGCTRLQFNSVSLSFAPAPRQTLPDRSVSSGPQPHTSVGCCFTRSRSPRATSAVPLHVRAMSSVGLSRNSPGCCNAAPQVRMRFSPSALHTVMAFLWFTPADLPSTGRQSQKDTAPAISPASPRCRLPGRSMPMAVRRALLPSVQQ